MERIKDFDIAVIRDPRITAQNRLEPHPDIIWYHDENEYNTGSNSLILSLDGRWQFAYAEQPEDIPAEFWSGDTAGWAQIQVPGHIQLQGWGRPQYVNYQYPWDGLQDVSPTGCPEQYNPVGCYQTTFCLPMAMQGQEVHIVFDGAESALAVFLNGRYVGYGTDGFTPSEFDLTPFLQLGENRLAVLVFQWTAAAHLECQDFFRFSGLFRSVRLVAVPKSAVTSVTLNPELSPNYDSGTLGFSLQSRGNGTVTVQLRRNGEMLKQDSAALSGGPDTIALALQVKAPALWSAEQPNLYEAVVKVANESGQVQQYTVLPFGFRRIEIKNGMILLNGKRLVIRGINRHEFYSKCGRAISPDLIEKDIQSLKRLNVNAVRTCHYPNQSAFYTLCDRYGLYVMDEANLEGHAELDRMMRQKTDGSNLAPGSNPLWSNAVMARAKAMLERDRNHPCVLFWSCGNECGGGENLAAMADYFRKADPTRLVHYENANQDPVYWRISDIAGTMYQPVDEVRRLLATHKDRPYLHCEYEHMMGNSGGNLAEYTSLADELPQYQGGFIWDFADQALETKDPWGAPCLGYGGDFGERPHDGAMSGNGILYADHSLSPKAQEVKACYTPEVFEFSDKSVKLHNRNLFTSTDAYRCVARLMRDGKPLREIEMADISVPPLSDGSYPLPLDALGYQPTGDGAEYCLELSLRLREATAWAEPEYEVAFGQKVWRDGAPKRQTKPEDTLHVEAGNLNIGVSGAGFSLLFSKLHGGLLSYRCNGEELLAAVPRPNFWRAPTDNDRGNKMGRRYGVWKLASMYSTFSETPKVEQRDGRVQLTFFYDLATQPAAPCTITYIVEQDGRVTMQLSYTAVAELPAMPEFGFLFEMNPVFHHCQWYGLGPEETYCDRCSGAKLGIWQNRVEDNMARYLRPQECGNHTGVRWAQITRADGFGLEFEADTPMDFSVLPYTPHELENADHRYMLPREGGKTVVRAALRQIGVGGDNTWGAYTHDEYLIHPVPGQPLRFTLHLSPVSGTDAKEAD